MTFTFLNLVDFWHCLSDSAVLERSIPSASVWVCSCMTGWLCLRVCTLYPVHQPGQMPEHLTEGAREVVRSCLQQIRFIIHFQDSTASYPVRPLTIPQEGIEPTKLLFQGSCSRLDTVAIKSVLLISEKSKTAASVRTSFERI